MHYEIKTIETPPSQKTILQIINYHKYILCRCTQKIIINASTAVAADSFTAKTVDDRPINKNKLLFAAQTISPEDIFTVW